MEADNYLHLFSFDVDIVKHDHLSKRLQSVGGICRIYSLFRILASYIVIFSKFGNVRITSPGTLPDSNRRIPEHHNDQYFLFPLFTSMIMSTEET